MAESAPPLVLSAVSVWELRLNWDRFRISGAWQGPIGPGLIVAFAGAVGWEIMALTGRHAVGSLREPLGHQDAFDELLLVQAQEEEGLWLLTRDAKLLRHGLVAG